MAIDQNKTCGDYGGLTMAGKPCRQPAGLHPDLPTDGRCSQHNWYAVQERETAKAVILTQLEANVTDESTEGLKRGGLTAACRAAGITPMACRTWMKADVEFGESVRSLVEAFDQSRALVVEDHVFGRILSDRATPAEIIFFLKNRDRERWQEGLSLPGRADKAPAEGIGQSARAKLNARLSEIANRRASAGQILSGAESPGGAGGADESDVSEDDA